MDEPFSTTSPQFHFFKKRFLMWAIFKAFIEFVTIMFLCFMFWFFGYESWDLSSLCVLCFGFLAMSHGILAPPTRG